MRWERADSDGSRDPVSRRGPAGCARSGRCSRASSGREEKKPERATLRMAERGPRVLVGVRLVRPGPARRGRPGSRPAPGTGPRRAGSRPPARTASGRRRRRRPTRSGRCAARSSGRSRSSWPASSPTHTAPRPRARRSPNRKKLSSPDQLADLDVGAVVGADGQRAVERELHVAGAGRLLAGQRDLLGQVGGRDELLGQRHVVVRRERHASAGPSTSGSALTVAPTALIRSMISLAIR